MVFEGRNYIILNEFQIIRSSTPMKKEPDLKSELISECLYGETVQLIKNKGEWAFSKLLTDSYHGWIKLKDINVLPKYSHLVIVPRTIVTSLPKVRSSFKFYLPLGSRIKVKREIGFFSEIVSHDNYPAFLPSSHLINIETKVKDWVSIAESLLHTPYKWGGRDTIGIDCSSLVQLCIQSIKLNLPRDTSEQIDFFLDQSKNIDYITRGSLVYWEGHVAIGVNEKQIIHSSGHHLKVIIEDFNDVIKRMKSEGFFVKKIIDTIQ